MVNIKENKCKLCRKEKTTWGFWYAYEEKPIPVCKKCVRFIKEEVKLRDFKKELFKELKL